MSDNYQIVDPKVGAMFGAARAVLGALGGRVLEREFPFPRAQDSYADGELTLTPEQSGALEEMLRELVASAEEVADARAQAQAATAA